jgi:hypothetical protein
MEMSFVGLCGRAAVSAVSERKSGQRWSAATTDPDYTIEAAAATPRGLSLFPLET